MDPAERLLDPEEGGEAAGAVFVSTYTVTLILTIVSRCETVLGGKDSRGFESQHSIGLA